MELKNFVFGLRVILCLYLQDRVSLRPVRGTFLVLESFQLGSQELKLTVFTKFITKMCKIHNIKPIHFVMQNCFLKFCGPENLFSMSATITSLETLIYVHTTLKNCPKLHNLVYRNLANIA